MVRRYIRQLSGKRRSETGDRRLGVVLAFTAGAINAGGFLAVGVYTSHMSGMVSSFADFIVLNRLPAAAWAMGYVIAFFFGAMTSSLTINWARVKNLHSEYALALMLEAALLLLFGLLATGWVGSIDLTLPLNIGLLCYIMGLQNGLITKISHSEIRTTHMTGVITDLGIEMGRLIFSKATQLETRFHPQKARLLIKLLIAFCAGGLIGAFSFNHIGFGAVLPFSALLAVIALVPVMDDLSRLARRKLRRAP